MQSKLTLEHLSVYLPYGLKFYIPNDEHSNIQTMTGLSKTDGIQTDYTEEDSFGSIGNLWCLDEGGRNYKYYNIKPILRPLSDFYKKITHNSKTFIPIVELANINFPKHDWYVVDKYQYIKTKKGGYSFEWDYGYNCWLFDGSSQMDQTALHYKMLEWHFDVFGLIEKDLAIDINTI